MGKRISKTNINLSEKSRPTVGVFLDMLSEPYHERYWSGLVDGALKHDINLLCFTDVYSPHYKEFSNQIKSIANLAKNIKIDSIINWSRTFSWIIFKDKFSDFFNKFKENPASLRFQSIPNDLPIVLMNSYQGIKDLMRHLITTHGFRRIAFIRGPEFHLAANERYRAYTDALKEFNIPFDPDFVTAPVKHWNEKSTIEVLNPLIKKIKFNIDAIVAVSDTVAYGALKTLKAHGVSVPKDIALAGFDDYPRSNSETPSLTTINPQFVEVGRQTIKMFVDILAGKKISLQQNVPAKLIIRESCGCCDPVLAQLKIKLTPEGFTDIKTKMNYKSEVQAKQKKILSEIKLIVTSSNEIKKSEKLFNAFINDLENEESNTFISLMEDILKSITNPNENTFIWHQVISLFRFHLIPLLDKIEYIFHAENLFQQARMMIEQTILRVNNHNRILEKQQEELLQKIENELITTFNINKLMDILAERLPDLGIPSCYLSLYEGDKFPYKWSRLMLAYKGKNRFKIDSNGLRFPSVNLIPDGFLSEDQNFKFVVEPLYFHNDQFGFVIFEIGPRAGFIYERLRNEISSAINGAILVKKMEEHTLELDKAYQELKENQQKLLDSEKKASLGRLIAGIAHEMNTPLATIHAAIKEIISLIDEYSKSINNSDVLPEDHKAIAAEMMEYVNMVLKATNKSSSFIRGIKGQTTILDSNIQETFNASQIILDALSLLEFKMKKNSCKLITKLDDSVVLYGDPRWLSQIITNLTNNAIDACSQKNGTITIKLIKSDQKKAKLTVNDTGIGITPENLSRIFDPLFTTKSFGEATGLGLSIVKELITQFNGSINVNSSPGLTTFIVELPLAKL